MAYKFKFNDGGRKAAGYTTEVDDCALRSIAIALDKNYQQLNQELTILNRKEVFSGCSISTVQFYLQKANWTYKKTPHTYLRRPFLPDNKTIILKLSKHITVLQNGLILDISNPADGGLRKVHGYWEKN